MLRLLGGELRQGALDGVMIEAIAKASGAPSADVRRALTLRGWLPAVGAAALAGGVAAAAGLQAGGRPGRLPDARRQRPQRRRRAGEGRHPGGAGVEARRHPRPGAPLRRPRSGCSPARSTTSPPRCPSWWRPCSALPVDDLVLDGEVIALRPDGRPHPFQVTAAGRPAAGPTSPRLREQTPLSVFFFDALQGRTAPTCSTCPTPSGRRSSPRPSPGPAHAPAGHGRRDGGRRSSSPT